MHICIDSCVFIQGLRRENTAITQLFRLVSPQCVLIVPRLIALEVTRNLRTLNQKQQFYALFQDYTQAFIVDEPVPHEYVNKYTHKGLPSKADAIIGGFAEWQQVPYLISTNRHFLRDLQTDAFEVLDPARFTSRWHSNQL